MLSVTIGPITGPDANGIFKVPSGKDLYVPLVGTDSSGNPITYTVTSSNSNVHAKVLTGNPTLQLNVTGTTAGGQTFSGTMTFQLFKNLAPQTVQAIINDVNSGLYNGATFYRAENSDGTGGSPPFQLIQGGVRSAASSVPTIPDELNVDAAFNSGGLLAMANTGAPNSASSEFFVTAPNVPLANEPQSSLNFGYTIFGQILTGLDIYNDILKAPTQLSGGLHIITNPVTITSASIINDTQHTVLQISEPSTFTGDASITVTAHGTDQSTASRSFKINAAHPTTSTLQLFLNPIVDRTTANRTSTSFQISATGISGINTSNVHFSVTGTNSFTGAPVNATAVVTSVNGLTATVTVTPNADADNSFLNLVAHVDFGTRHIDALPFSIEVGSALTIDSVTSPVNSASAAASSVAGHGEIGATISVVATDGTHTSAPQIVTVNNSGDWSVNNLNITGLSDGKITYTATLTDSHDNTKSASKTATKDTVPPSVAITSVTNSITSSNLTNTKASGTGTAGATISVIATDGTHSTAPQTATVGSGGKWSVTGINVSGLNDGTITYRATTSDAANNSATDTEIATKNTAGTPTQSTTTTVTSNHSTGSTFGQSVTFTATVTATSGTPTGSIQFKVDGTNFGSAKTLSGGSASFSTATLGVGNHTITAVYTSDSANFTSSQDADTLSVTKSSTAIAVHVPSSTIDITQAPSITATITPVSPGAGSPTGTVTFKEGNTTLGTANIGSGGTATLNLAAGSLALGGHNITAIYNGDSNFIASPLSSIASLTVTSGSQGNSHSPVLGITGPNKGVRGQLLSYTFTATDPDTSDVAPGFNYTINWGDGHTQTINRSANNGTQTVQHTYHGGGNFHISATATDLGGNVSLQANQTVAISAIRVAADTVNSAKKDLYIGGTNGGDSIMVLPWGGNRLGVLLNGHFMGSFAVSTVYVFAQGGNDMVMVSPGVHTPTVLDGGAGSDHLFGGSGRNFLIGGTGRDSLSGGGSGDVFVGGSSTLEGNAAALNSVMAEWCSGNSFATRKQNLSGTGSGTGHNGQVFLKTGASNPTVIDDGAVDKLMGFGGFDWHLPG